MLLWARAAEPSSEQLAEDAFVDHPKLVSGWLADARRVVAAAQTESNANVQLGGVGVEVELDEICFRARWAQDEDGHWGKEWIRYIAAYERHTGRIVLKQLPVRFAKGGGQGGGGALSSEELHDFLFRPGGTPLLLPGTIVHTDGARAYRDLHWTLDPDFPEQPTEELVQRVTHTRPSAWRLESFQEVLEREAAERRNFRGRDPVWSAKYAGLRLVHTSVCHTKQKGGVARRQFVAVRRVRPHPDDVAAYEENRDPWLLEGITWRKAGTQTVDGYWTTLRKRGAHRGINTRLRDGLHNAVLVHQWAYLAGPSANMVAHLGTTLREYRATRAREVDAAVDAGAAVEVSASAARGRLHMAASAKASVQRERRRAQARIAAAAFAANARLRKEEAEEVLGPDAEAPAVEAPAVEAPVVSPPTAAAPAVVAPRLRRLRPLTAVESPSREVAAPTALESPAQRRAAREVESLPLQPAARRARVRARVESMEQQAGERMDRLVLSPPGSEQHRALLAQHAARLQHDGTIIAALRAAAPEAFQ